MKKNNKRWKRELYQKSGRHSWQAVPLYLPDLGRYSGKFGQGRVQREHKEKLEGLYVQRNAWEGWGVPEIASPRGWRLRAHYFENALTWPYLRVLHRGVKFDRFLLILILFCFFSVIPSKVPAGYHRKQT